MEKRLGLIAGSGESPLQICREAQTLGYTCVVAAIQAAADPLIEADVNDIAWFQATQPGAIVSFFKSLRVEEAVFAGKIDPRLIFRDAAISALVDGLLQKEQDRKAETLIQLAIDYFDSQGIRIVDTLPFLKKFLCVPGVLTKNKPSPTMLADMDFAWELTRKLADWDIGQSLVVKNRQVVAVEGLEGTDAAIKRGGELAGEGTVLVKVVRSHQDSRIDLPAVGLKTVEALISAQAAALCFEAERLPFFQQEQAIRAADQNNLAIVARK
jgi:DUF1009 family protein